MKYLYLLLALSLPLNLIRAQSVTVGNLSKSVICFGDTIWVPYSSSGTFQADNFFSVQLSDANGSFSTFINVGKSAALQDSVPIVIGYTADHFRFRVISTDPYMISSDTSSALRVVGYPNVNPTPNEENIFYGAAGFAGDQLHFHDLYSQSAGSTFLWKFDQDANTVWSTVDSPIVTYSSDGVKTGSLTITNSAGCPTTKTFQIRILSCHPAIPDSVHVVTNNESGNFPYVWVKAGGNYTAIEGNDINSTVYVEPGGSSRSEFRSTGLYYVRNGGSFISSNGQGYATVVMNRGNTISWNSYNDVDTLYCDNLQFDYSKVGGGADVPVAENPLHIQLNPNQLHITDEGENIWASIVNILGETILSRSGKDEITLDYSALPDGVYFAIITSGDHREIRKIAVVH